MRLWPQIVVIVSIVLPVVFACLRLAGVKFVKPDGWAAQPPKYRSTPLVVALIIALLQAVVLGYGGFWEPLR